MSRSGYTEDCGDDLLQLGRWRGQVLSAIRGRRGQKFLKELAAAMDAMPAKELIANELINEEGQCCTIGVICKARGIDVSKVDCEDTKAVGDAVGIAAPMAAEIEFENDDDFGCGPTTEDPAKRWKRMRDWVQKQIKE